MKDTLQLLDFCKAKTFSRPNCLASFFFPTTITLPVQLGWPNFAMLLLQMLGLQLVTITCLYWLKPSLKLGKVSLTASVLSLGLIQCSLSTATWKGHVQLQLHTMRILNWVGFRFIVILKISI